MSAYSTPSGGDPQCLPLASLRPPSHSGGFVRRDQRHVHAGLKARLEAHLGAVKTTLAIGFAVAGYNRRVQRQFRARLFKQEQWELRQRGVRARRREGVIAELRRWSERLCNRRAC